MSSHLYVVFFTHLQSTTQIYLDRKQSTIKITNSEANITRGSQILSLQIKSSHDDKAVQAWCLPSIHSSHLLKGVPFVKPAFPKWMNFQKTSRGESFAYQKIMLQIRLHIEAIFDRETVAKHTPRWCVPKCLQHFIPQMGWDQGLGLTHYKIILNKTKRSSRYTKQVLIVYL